MRNVSLFHLDAFSWAFPTFRTKSARTACFGKCSNEDVGGKEERFSFVVDIGDVMTRVSDKL